MAQYIVKKHQNIFDIAIELYGSVEGVFDLLISNPKLSMADILQEGDILECHPSDFMLNDGVVKYLQNNNMSIQNGCRHVYYKEIDEKLRITLYYPTECIYAQISLSGNGTMAIDWGDNTDIEYIHLNTKEQKIAHYFNNIIDEKRQIKIYGEFSIQSWRQIDNEVDIRPITPITVDEVYANGFLKDLLGFNLFDGTVVMNLQRSRIDSLAPIIHMSLQELDLTDVDFKSVDVLDEYLVGLVNNYQNRRNCIVKLTTEPGPNGMDAIHTIINEPSWNESGAWKFIINDTIYTYNEQNIN